MEPNEIQQFQAQFASFGDRLSKMEGKQDKMFFALMGNELSQDGGLIQRIKDLEEENIGLRDDLETIEKAHAKSDTHLKLLLVVIGSALTLIGKYVIDVISKS